MARSVTMNRSSTWLARGVPLTLVAGLACVEADRTGWSGTLVDSAGVAVVTSPMDDRAPRRVARPDLVIGADDSRPETLFGYVADVEVDAEGRVYVLDQHAQEVRVFGADGGSLGVIGRAGDGPGELSAFAASLILTGDTLAVGDWGRSRLHRFLLDGSFVDSRPFPGGGGPRSWWSAGADGSLLFRSLRRLVREDGRWGGHDALYRVGAAHADEADTLLVFTYPVTDLGGPGNVRLPLVVDAPFWAQLADGRVVWGTLQAEELRFVGPTGLERIARAEDWRLEPPSDAENTALIDLAREKMRMLGGSPQAVDAVPVDRPRVLPAITSVLAGPDGTIWVQRRGEVGDVHPMAINSPDPPTGWGGSHWDVLDGEGRRVGIVETPPRFRASRIRGTHVYGVLRDRLGVESVVRLEVTRLERGASP